MGDPESFKRTIATLLELFLFVAHGLLSELISYQKGQRFVSDGNFFKGTGVESADFSGR